MAAREKELTSKYTHEVKGIWRDFLSDTTLHGCKPIQRTNKHYLQRLIWAILVLTAGFFLVSYLIKLYVEYSKYPFETQTRVERVTNMKLPAISVCNMNQVSKAKYNLTKRTVEAMLSKHVLVNVFGNFSNYTISDGENARINNIRIEDVLVKREDFILKAYVADREVDIAAEFVMNSSPIFRKCFTFNGMKEDGSGGEITLAHGQYFQVLLNINQTDYFPYANFAGVHLIFHDPAELPSPVSQTVDVAPGYSTTVTLEPTKYHFLPRPYKSYGDEYCEDFSASTRIKKLRWHKRYTWVACVEECVIRTAIATCQCRPWEFTSDFQSERICSIEELYQCFYVTAGKVRNNVITHNATACECPQPCEFVHYGIRSSVSVFPTRQVADFLVSKGLVDSHQSITDDYVDVQMTFDGMILQHVQHVPTFSFGEIISRLGGQMGFFLGASLLTLTEIIEAVLVTIMSVVTASLRRERKIGNTK